MTLSGKDNIICLSYSEVGAGALSAFCMVDMMIVSLI